MKNRKIKIFAIACITILCLGLMITKIWAYFFTKQETTGQLTLSVSVPQITLEETVTGMTKNCMVCNSEQSENAYVRLKAFAPAGIEISYEADEGWTPGGDGYYYYTDILCPGVTTTEICIRIETGENIGQDCFGIAVIAEAVKVQYDEAGNSFADWEAVYQSGESTE